MTRFEEGVFQDVSIRNTMGNLKNYSMPVLRPKTGKALIISTHTDFTQNLNRLEEFFLKQGLVVETNDCPGKTEFVLSVLEFSNSFEDEHFNCAVVVILSHSKNGDILAADGKEMAVENDIIGRFSNKDCPALKGKPKFFLLHTILEEEKEKPFSRLYLRKKVKNGLIIQSAVMESERNMFLDSFCENFAGVDFANIDNPGVEHEREVVQTKIPWNNWWLKITASYFENISKDFLSSLVSMGVSEKELLNYLNISLN